MARALAPRARREPRRLAARPGSSPALRRSPSIGLHDSPPHRPYKCTMANVLVTIPFSHFCEKARWALDHARVAYREEGHGPGLHRLATRRAGGRHTVPVL